MVGELTSPHVDRLTRTHVLGRFNDYDEISIIQKSLTKICYQGGAGRGALFGCITQKDEMDMRNKLLSVALASAMVCSSVSAEESSSSAYGDINLLFGSKSLEESDWAPVDD